MKKCHYSLSENSAIHVGLLKKVADGIVSDEFNSGILNTLIDDEVGNLCRSDVVILNVGLRHFDKSKRKLDKLVEVKKSVRNDMRRLATLYIYFKKENVKKVVYNNAHDMFVMCNFDALTQEIIEYTSKDDGGMESGLKQALYYLILASAKIIRASWLVQEKDEEASEVEKFLSVLKMYEHLVFGDAEYELAKQRRIKLRRPAQFPLEQDIETIREYTVKKMKELVDKYHFHDNHDYVELRNAACVRATLLNARRGSEPARMLISDRKEGEKDAWIDHQCLTNLDPLESMLVKQMKKPSCSCSYSI